MRTGRIIICENHDFHRVPSAQHASGQAQHERVPSETIQSPSMPIPPVSPRSAVSPHETTLSVPPPPSYDEVVQSAAYTIPSRS